MEDDDDDGERTQDEDTHGDGMKSNDDADGEGTEDEGTVAEGKDTDGQVRQCLHFWRLRPSLGRPLARSLTPGPKIFAFCILRSTAYKSGKFRFSGPFSFGDMKPQTLSFVQWRCQQRAHRACEISPSTNPKMETAVMRYFDVLGQDKSIPSALWWAIFRPKVTFGL